MGDLDPVAFEHLGEFDRVEVIDHTASKVNVRAWGKRGRVQVAISEQDDGKTLKVFVYDD